MLDEFWDNGTRLFFHKILCVSRMLSRAADIVRTKNKIPSEETLTGFSVPRTNLRSFCNLRFFVVVFPISRLQSKFFF